MLVETWRKLSPSRKRNYIYLIPLILAGSVAEMISISAVLPFIGAITAPEMVFSNSLARPIIEHLEISTPEELIAPMTVMFVSAIILTGAIRLLLLYSITRLSYATGTDISVDIYQRTLFQPYETHVQRNSSEIINAISTKSNIFISNTIYPVLSITSSAFILVAILIVLIATDPIISLGLLSSFSLLYYLIIFFSKRKLKNNSTVIAKYSTYLIKQLQEGLGGVRDVILDGAQKAYIDNYHMSDTRLRTAEGSNLVLSQSPRFLLETFGISLIAIVAYTMNFSGENIGTVIPTLTVMALGAQRLMPSAQQIYFGWSNLVGGRQSLIDVLTLLDQQLPESSADSHRITFDRSIRLSGVSYKYGGSDDYVLKNVDFTLRKGECVGVIGKSGCGKSTFLDILMGLLEPTEGSLFVDDIEITRENAQAWYKCIAHVPQSIFLTDDTIANNIAFGAETDDRDEQKIVHAARLSNLDATISSWPDQYETVVGERGVRLSGGQRQRIGLARAFYKHSKLLVLDEATSSLDEKTEREMLDLINAEQTGNSRIMVAHRLRTLESCDYIIEIENGTIARTHDYNDLIRDIDKAQ